MRIAKVFVNKRLAGRLIEENREDSKKGYIFTYEDNYQGAPVSLTMPINQKIYEFNEFPPFFEGVLPEGPQLEALLRRAKLDRNDYFGQLIVVGADLVGAVTIEEEQT